MYKYLLNLLIIFFSLSAYADTWSVTSDNDFVFGSDDKYTGGANIIWMGEEYAQSDEKSFTHSSIAAMSGVVGFIPFVAFENKYRNVSIGVSEVITTPSNISIKEPIYTDIPYSGILRTNFSLFLWDEESFDEFYFSFGILGSNSGAEDIQKYMHKLYSNSEPQGWDNQLKTKLVLGVGYLKGMKHFTYNFTNKTQIEWFNSYFFDLDNIYTVAGLGTVLRFGYNMPKNFAAISGLVSTSANHMLNCSSRTAALGLSLELGVSLNQILYDYAYGESKKLGYDYEKSSQIVKGKIGLNAYIENWKFSLEMFPVYQKNEQLNSLSWGRVNVTWTF
ncbi:lipid A deacylase LpxR family protein [bacterium]|nr:lipid A deacylase LpxR family protein [bacterium]MBU1993410.1 lipid A deacylase LpxR family protein [bacterium]